MKFVSKYFKSDSGEVLRQYMLHLLYSSVNAQTNFFGKTVPLQVSLSIKNIDKLMAQQELILKSLMAKHGLNKDRLFPSVEHMAIDAKLKHLYDFLYHATSRMVHFSPNVLARMGWYDKDGPTVFSSENFYKYYESFNKFYGPYLLIELCTTFKKELNLSKEFLAEIKSIKKSYTKYSVYPELITFEEMNLKRPTDNVLSRIIVEMSQMENGEEILAHLHTHLTKETETKENSSGL
jgi:hypothetical protein